MLEDHERLSALRSLIAQFGAMKALAGYTPQSRGQEFNRLVANALSLWGVPAKAEVRGTGECDVVFSIGDLKFLMECKWEQQKTDLGPLVKLGKRLRQRLRGPIGVFLSMAGYTKPALDQLRVGEQLEMVLLDSEHFEAFLSGLFPPDELLNLVIEAASFKGDPYSSLLDLAGDGLIPEISFDEPKAVKPLVRQVFESMTVETVVSRLSGASGVFALSSQECLVTLTSGIHRVAWHDRMIQPETPFNSCYGNPRFDPDEGTTFIRKNAVARIEGRRVRVLTGALQPGASFVTGTNSGAWIFSNSTHPIRGGPGTLTFVKLSHSLGEETFHEVAFEGSAGRVATRLPSGDFLALHHQRLVRISLDGAVHDVNVDLSRQVNVAGLEPIGQDQFLILSGEVRLSRLNLRTLTVSPIADLRLLGSAYELSFRDGTGYLLAHYQEQPNQPSNELVVRFAF